MPDSAGTPPGTNHRIRQSPIQADDMWHSTFGPSVEHFSFRESTGDTANRLNGQLLRAIDRSTVHIYYEILADSRWHTREARISVNSLEADILLSGDGAGHWSMADVSMNAFGGFLDVDLRFTPSTNLLPIRRLNLAVGESAAVQSVWLRFPEFTLEPLYQTYTRTHGNTYLYTSATGYEGKITVDEHGIPIQYGDVWERVGQSP